MLRVFPEALDPCFVCFTLSRSSPCNAYQRWQAYRSGGGGGGGGRINGDGCDVSRMINKHMLNK